MVTLKKIVFVILLTQINLIYSQDNQKIREAFEKSYVLEYEGKFSEAIQKLKSFYSEDSYEINLRLGWLYYELGMFTESMPYYQNCITLRPLSIEARLGIVYPASSLGNWTQVENYYHEILGIDPQNTLVNYRVGLLLYGRESYSEAFKYFEKVVNLYPFDYDAVIMLALTNYKLGKYREAKVLYNKALLIKPNDESALQGLELIK